MKKIVLALTVLLLSGSLSAFANCGYDCVMPYDMNNKFRRTTAAVTGFNFLTEKKAQSILQKEILKIVTGENIKVKLDSYSPRDLRNGIFKSVQVSGDNVLINDIHLTHLDLKSLCDFNYIQPISNDIVFKEDFPMAFDVTMTAQDINRTMRHPRYQKVIDDTNKVIGTFAKGVSIESTKVSIVNRKLYYIIGFHVPFIRNPQKLVFQFDIRIRKGKLEMANAKVVSNNFNLDMRKADYLLKYLNPFDFSVNILNNKDARVQVDDVDIADSTIKAKGVIIVPKESYE